MIYIYNCFGGTHSSSLASAIHLKKLAADKIPTKEEILNTEYFNTLTYKDMGRIIYRGTDDEGNKVYTIGRGTSRVLIPCLRNLISLLQEQCGLKEKIIFSNMSPTVTRPMTFGGFFSRCFKINFIGVPLLVFGARIGFKKMVKIVELTKEKAKSSNEQIIVLQNNSKEKLSRK